MRRQRQSQRTMLSALDILLLCNSSAVLCDSPEIHNFTGVYDANETTITSYRRENSIFEGAEKRTWLCEGNDDMTDDLRVQLLDDHNRYRSLTARGLAEDPEGDNGYAPKAAKMKKLVYDCNLEVSAQDHANLCKFQHSNVPYGENLFYAPMFFDKYQAVDTASRMWFDELKKFGVGPENMLKNWSVGHYTQMVWGWTEKLGCGVKECLDGSVLLVCQYDPAGNYQQYPIYKVGEPCSDCTCKQCECDPDEGLCYVPELPTSEPGSDFAS